MRHPTFPLACALLPALACAHSSPAPSATAPTATSAAITPGDLRARLSIYADDSMQGRKAGTPGNVKATEYIAAEARRIGLEPAGDGGGWFQTLPLVERSLVSAASVTAGGASFVPWRTWRAMWRIWITGRWWTSRSRIRRGVAGNDERAKGRKGGRTGGRSEGAFRPFALSPFRPSRESFSELQ